MAVDIDVVVYKQSFNTIRDRPPMICIILGSRKLTANIENTAETAPHPLCMTWFASFVWLLQCLRQGNKQEQCIHGKLNDTYLSVHV